MNTRTQDLLWNATRLAVALLFGAVLGTSLGIAQDEGGAKAETPKASEEKNAGDSSDESSAETTAETTAEATPEKAKDPDVVRERTLYVPYEKLDEVFEKEGRVVFLPYAEFLKLWRAGDNKTTNPEGEPPPADAVVRDAKYSGRIENGIARFDVRFAIDSLKEDWSTLDLSFRDVAVESVDVGDTKALISAGKNGYRVLLPGKGRYEVKLAFSTRVLSTPGKKSLRFGIPAITVSDFELTIPEESVRVDAGSGYATTKSEGGKTVVSAQFGGASSVALQWTPPQEISGTAAAVVFAEQELRAQLGERNLRLTSKVAYTIERGEVDTFRIRNPAGLTLLKVVGENIREWTEEDEILVVRLHSAVSKAYNLTLSFDRVLEETPPSLSVALPRVENVRRETGWLALGHAGNLKVRVQSASGLSQLDPEEIPPTLRQGLTFGFRYLAPPPAIDLGIETILPVVRSRVTSVITLGEDEDSWVGFVDYDITRAGIFRLELRIPRRWNVVEIGDDKTTADPQTTTPDAQASFQTITVKLKTRVIGNYRLPFLFSADGSSSTTESTFLAPQIVGTEQDRGLLAITAARSLELTTQEKTRLRSTDVQDLFRAGIMGRVSSETGTPLAYAYHDNRADEPASVKLRVEPKNGEIHSVAQLLVEVDNDRLRFTHFLDYEILYSEVDSVSFLAPAALDDTLKIESRDIKERRKSRTPEGQTLWEIVLQAPTVGNVSLTVTHLAELGALEAGKPSTQATTLLRPQKVDSETGFVAIKKEGTLEVKAEPKEMETIESTRLPDKLRRGKIGTALRYFSANPGLSLTLTRYDYEQLASASIDVLLLKSLVSDQPCRVTTKATFLVRNSGQQHLEILLPSGASVLDLRVQGKRANPKKRKDGVGYLCPLPPPAPDQTVVLEFVYAQDIKGELGSFGSVSFAGPQVLGDVPIGHTEIDLYVPQESRYLSWSGNARQTARRELQVSGGGASGFELPTQYRRHIALSSYAPVTQIGFVYASPGVYQGLQGLALVVALAAGLLLGLRTNLSPLWASGVAILVPLAGAWFFRGPLTDVAECGIAGGGLAAAFFALRYGRVLFRNYREYRSSIAPDPYLEDAGAPETESAATGDQSNDAPPNESVPAATDAEPAPESSSPTESASETETSAESSDVVPPPTTEDSDETKNGETTE